MGEMGEDDWKDLWREYWTKRNGSRTKLLTDDDDDDDGDDGEYISDGSCNQLQLVSHTEYKILCLVDRAFLYNLVNKANLLHSFSWYVSLHPAYQTVIHTE